MITSAKEQSRFYFLQCMKIDGVLSRECCLLVNKQTLKSWTTTLEYAKSLFLHLFTKETVESFHYDVVNFQNTIRQHILLVAIKVLHF